jgi:DNA processing protein
LGGMKFSEIEALDELSIIACLDNIKGVGPVKFRKIFETFKTFSSFWKIATTTNEIQIDDKAYRNILDPRFLAQIKEFAPSLDLSREFMEQQLSFAKNSNGKLLTYHDPNYPANLYNSSQCAPILYVIGNVGILRESNCCAIVGTKNPSEWSKDQTEKAVQTLLTQNTVVVSDLAKGIDTIAHSTALNMNGKTIAVLGSGADICYPVANKPLYEEIKQRGVIVSEYPFGTPVTPVFLQRRDKQLVGLSKNVLIVESAKDSSIVNAYKAAVEQKKTVGVFVPPLEVAGDFSGNQTILTEKKVKVLSFSKGKEVSF